MPKLPKLILPFFVAAVALLGASVNASAAVTFELDQRVDGTESYSRASGIDQTMRTTLRHMRAGVELERSSYGSGHSYIEIYAALLPGDVVEVYSYPAGDPELPPIPMVPPTRSIVVPGFTVSAAAGSNVISGTAGTDWAIWIAGYKACSYEGLTTPAANNAGAFSGTLTFSLIERSYYSVMGRNASGDIMRRGGQIPGDALCVEVDAAKYPGSTSAPYDVEVEGLDSNVAPTTRIRLLRAGSLIAEDDSDELDLTLDQKPLPGDVIEVYRPKGAATPARVVTIPSVSGVFDPGNDLVAIDSPPAQMIDVYACRPVGCDESYDGRRSARDLPGGRTMFDFASSQGSARPYALFAGDSLFSYWLSSDARLSYDFQLSEGDLTSPIGTVKLAKKLKAKGLTKKLKFKLTSSEAGNMSAKLTLDPVKKKGKKKPAKAATLASGKSSVKVGSNSLSLKTTRSGKKALKKIAKAKKSVNATLTLTLTDASGNVTTIVKSTKLK